MSSVSRIGVTVQTSAGESLKAEFHRHLAPVTVATIVEKKRLSGYIAKFENQFVYFQVGLVLGAEKSRRKFESKEIAFIPSNGALAFFLRSSTSKLPMNPVGRMISGIEPFESLGPGAKLDVRVED